MPADPKGYTARQLTRPRQLDWSLGEAVPSNRIITD
jgi:hypothetical protein